MEQNLAKEILCMAEGEGSDRVTSLENMTSMAILSSHSSIHFLNVANIEL